MPRKPKRVDDNPVLLCVVSDIHAGSSVAVMPPEVALDDGQTVKASKLQRWLWQCWNDMWGEWARLREEHGARLVVVLNGDIMDGPNHHGTVQSVSSHPGVERDIAHACLKIPRALGVDAWHVIRGTEGHSGKGAPGENGVAKWLHAVKDPDTGQESTYYRQMAIQGVRLDVSHHGRGGYLPWTEGPAAVRYAMQVFTEYSMDREPPPDIILRGHLHRFHDTASLAPARLIQTPPWKLADAYSHRIALSARKVEVGGAAILIRHGTAEVFPFRRAPERSRPWSA